MHEKSFKIETIHEVNSSIFRLFYTSNKYSIVELVSQALDFLKVLSIFLPWPVWLAVSYVARRFPSRHARGR